MNYRRAVTSTVLIALLTVAVAAQAPVTVAHGIAYSTYLGGTGDEADVPFEGVTSVAVDASGNVYVAGTTQSSDFPITGGAGGALGAGDVFVTKLSPAGTIVYSTVFGGACEDSANAIAVDDAGNAYVTGRFNGGSCYADQAGALVLKLGSTGAVVYASVLGGTLADTSSGQAIAVDAAGHAYVAGVANVASNDFPTTAGAFRTAACANVYANGFAGDGFVAKLGTDGSTLVYSTLLCGQGDDAPSGIAIDAAGNAYVAGTTASSDFPTLHAFQDARPSGLLGLSGFVTKLAPDGAHLVYSTYLGGGGSEIINGLAVDAAGSAYVTGVTSSTDYPTTAGVVQPIAGNRFCIYGCTDAFVTKLAPSGSALVYSTYLFGELDDAGAKIAVDGAGHAHVVGTTNSANFPIVDAFQRRDRGLDDAFVAELDADASRIVFSSYLGGTGPGASPGTGADSGTGIALDPSGNTWVVGYTQSFDFPTTPGAAKVAIGPGTCDVSGTPCGDAFVTKIAANGGSTVPSPSLRVTPSSVAAGGTVTATWTGIPIPSSQDHIRLYTLGSPDGYPGEYLAWWPTPGAASGTLLLALPGDLAAGWYELRLYSPDPDFSNLPQLVARSEPILVGGIASSATPTKTTTPVGVPTASRTATPVATPTKSATPAPSATATPVGAPTASRTATPVATPTKSATPTRSATATPSGVTTASRTATAGATPTTSSTATPFGLPTPMRTATSIATQNESTPTPAATPVDDAAARTCRGAIATAAAAFLQADAKAVGACAGRVVAGKLPRDTDCRAESKTAAAIAKGRRKLASTIAKACGGKDKTCGAGDDDVALGDVGWSVSGCPGIPDGGCADPIADCGDLSACLGCIADAGVDRLVALAYGALVPTSPKSKAEKALNKCQATIGRAGTALVAAESKAIAGCRRAVEAGDASGPCPDADPAASAAIAQAESRAEAAICKACAGPDRECGGADDLGPTEIGFVATCPALRSPRTGGSCARTVATIADVAACVECVTAAEVEGAERAAVPQTGAP